MASWLFVANVVVPFDGRLLERPIHALDLAVGPRVVGLGQAVLCQSASKRGSVAGLVQSWGL